MTYSEEEQEKFTSIFRQHYRVLIGKAYDILHSHHLAEDAVEEAFIRALKHLVDCRRQTACGQDVFCW